MTQSQEFDEWGIVEVMGHNRFAGRIMEHSIGGCQSLRAKIAKRRIKANDV